MKSNRWSAAGVGMAEPGESADMPRRLWRGPPDRLSWTSLDGGQRTVGYTPRELEEIEAVALRAEACGIDPRRVLAALGVDPLTFEIRARRPLTRTGGKA